ncbi:hypothetical protein ACH5AO_04330 [Streptomyces sp. NPDC018964]|uniref:hypothetical protein n=2 Tax=unclassified Streptomyces TaxID=2593676 RepID=UPI0037B0E5A8
MRRKEVAVLSLSAAALLMAGGGSAHAQDGPKFQNDNKIFSCTVLEVIDIPILSSANNNIDCSTNYNVEQKEYVSTEDDHRN